MKGLSIILFVLSLGSECFATTSDQEKPKTAIKERMKRFSIFSLVQFPNSQCILAMSTATNVMKGTCFTSSECAANGGTASGNCASGFGVCCMFSVSACGSTISKNCTYIQNPGFASSFTTPGACTYTFQSTPAICQIRLDLDIMTLSNPTLSANIGSVCTVDSFKAVSVTSPAALSPLNPPILCGVNDGTHMYLETGRLTNAATLTMTLGTLPAGATATRTWKIKASFIECGSPGIAPPDCLQYFTGVSGSFTSFNFQSGIGRFLVNQNYNVCFRQAEGFCTLSLRQDSSILNSFVLEQLGIAAPFTLSSSRTCTTTWVQIPTMVIPLGGAAISSNNEIFCGGYLNQIIGQAVPGTVTANVNPWTVGVFSTNAQATGTMTSIGFKLLYQQNPCT